MSDCEVFGNDDNGAVYFAIACHIVDAYASGFPAVRIFIDSDFIYKCLECWTPGWIRKSGPSGIWKNSQGLFCMFKRLILNAKEFLH